uniref:Adhesion G protein-coupled receptor D2 n=1 Tax=Oryzias latipes TaxID=8090 RepID=A0A3P9I025_ORYLA
MGRLSFLTFLMHICFHNIAAGNGQTRTLMYETHYAYVTDHMQWEEARIECEKRSGSLVSNPTENQELARVLKCLNISQEVWIASKYLTENSSLFLNTVVDSLGNESSLENQTLSFFHIPSHEVCGIFDPVNETVTFADCSVRRGAVCQLKNDTLDISKPPFINRFNKDPQIKLVMEGTHLNSYCNSDLTSLQLKTQTVLDSMEDSSPHLLTPSDVLTLSQMIDAITSSSHLAEIEAAEALVSITTNYVNAASWMLEPHMAAHWIGPTADGVNVGPFTIVKSIDSLTKALADTLSAHQRDFTLSTKNIEVYIKWQKLSQMSSDQVFKPSSVGSHHPKSGRRDELLIPDSELKRIHSLGSEEVMFIHTHYSHFLEVFNRVEEPELHQQEKIEKSVFPGHLSSSVISAAVRDSLKAQTIPVIVQYTLSTHVVENSQRFTPECAFWNFSLMHGGSWSSQGCSVVFSGSNVVSCLCNHTTNFAVLMKYMDTEWNPEEELVLSKLTFIGCGASLCALVVTLMLFTVLDIPKSDRTSIHKNLFVALICAQVILLCSGSAIHSKVACTLVAALLHLFFLAAFSWMLVEGLLLWSKVVAVNLNEDRHMKYYYLIGWGLPVLIVTITLASASGKYAADDYCWLSVQNGIIWGFAGPVIFIIMVNIFVLTRVVIITVSTARRRSIMLAMGASPVKQAYEQIRGAVKAVLVLLPILGLTWLCGVLVPLSIVMAYIFILLNSLQGLFIFLIYGVYNTEVRSTVNRMKERRKALNFSNCASSRPSSSVTNSRPVSFPLGTTPSQEEETCPCSSTPSLVIEENKTKGEPTIQCVPVRPEESWCQTP